MNNRLPESYTPFRWDPKNGAVRMSHGQSVTCTNRNTREFTYGVSYTIERVMGRCNGGGCLAMVRNDNQELRVLTSLAWSMGHWQVSPEVTALQVAGMQVVVPDSLKYRG